MVLALMLTPTMAFAQNSESQKLDYVALGDSLAAGTTPYNKISDGYTDFLSNKLKEMGVLSSFNKSFAVPGYTTTDVLKDIQDNVSKQDSTGENINIQTAIKQAEIITLDAGANDLLTQLVIDKTTGKVSYDQAKLETALKGVGENTAKIVGAIRTLNPTAKIYLMGYYNPFPYFPAEQQELLLPLLDLLNKTLSEAGKAFNVVFVPTGVAFKGSAKDYLPNPENIHPNEKGYLVIANNFWKKMTINDTVSFTDKLPSTSKEEINFLAQKGIVTGYQDGKFAPYDLIKRSQSAVMLKRAIVYGQQNATNPNYKDVSEKSFGYEAIAQLTQEGVFSGSGGYFHPGDTLTRAQMAKILVEAFHLSGTANKGYKDVNKTHWAAKYINILAANHIAEGFTDGSFKPNESITRAEFSLMLARTLK